MAAEFPFLPKRNRSSRPWPTVAMFAAILVLYALYEWDEKHRASAVHIGSAERLLVPRLAPDEYGRAGDFFLTGPSGASLIVDATPDIVGHRPLLAAVVDLAVDRSDVTDPLISFRPLTLDAKGFLVDIPWRTPQSFACPEGGAGVRTYGGIGTGLTHEICVVDAEQFSFMTKANAVAEGASIVDELNVGSLGVVVSHGVLIDGEADTDFVAFGDKGIGALVEAPIHATRSVSHFGAEVFPAPVILRYRGDKEIRRRLRVVRGDALSALAKLGTANRAFDVTFGPDRGGEVSLCDDKDTEITRGRVEPGATRSFRLPPGLGDHLTLRDDRGVVTDPRIALPTPGAKVVFRATALLPAKVALEYKDETGAPLPVHVLFKGIDGTPDPRPAGTNGRVVRAGRSLYLLDGHADVTLPAGRYRITASHGTAYSLVTAEQDLTTDVAAKAGGVLRAVVDTSAWVSADFHLHSAPSPDSDVSLEERVQSLLSEGVQLAVATDHNRVSDFSPSVRALGQESRIRTAPGVEITSAGAQRWGHFNAYPMPIPSGAPEQGVPVYFGKRPAEMFESARQFGARVIQVNHARMEPAIGYFDLAHLDAKTGRAIGEFSSDFDAFEAYNGMWIETREKVREGPRDLVALARRGKRVAALGDSDSHKLLYEEAGYPRTYLHIPAEPADTRFERAVQMLLGDRDTTVTSGPFVEMTVDGHAIGSVVQPASGSVHVKVRVSAPSWVSVDRVEMWRDDGVVRTFPVPGPPKDGVRFEGELDVPLEGADRTLLAWAEGDAPLPDVVPYEHALSIGFTGLVYVDTNKDGNVVVPEAPP